MHLNVAKHSHDYNPRTVATAHLRLFIMWGAVQKFPPTLKRGLKNGRAKDVASN